MLHLERQILPGIAAYEVLQTVMEKSDALNTVHGYVETNARSMQKKAYFPAPRSAALSAGAGRFLSSEHERCSASPQVLTLLSIRPPAVYGGLT